MPIARSHIRSIKCSRMPAAELWTSSALARHVRRQAVAAGFPALAKAGKASVQAFLPDHPRGPTKSNYLERRDPDFKRKMREVLLVYRESGASK